MKRINRILGILITTALTSIAVPSALWAESGVPDPGNFFATTPEFDPNANGTKYSGTLTITYVFSNRLTCPGLTISNMYVVLTLQQGNDMKPFNTDFTRSGTTPFCFDNTPAQIQFVLNLIRDQAIPHFYGSCPPIAVAGSTCPRPFKVKSLTNFLSSGTGAVSTNITIAVQ